MGALPKIEPTLEYQYSYDAESSLLPEAHPLFTLLHEYSNSRVTLTEDKLEALLAIIEHSQQFDPALPQPSIQQSLHGKMTITFPLLIFKSSSDPLDPQYDQGRYKSLTHAIEKFLEQHKVTSHSGQGMLHTQGMPGDLQSLLLKVVIPSRALRDPRARTLLTKEQLEAFSAELLLFYAFLSFQQTTQPNNELLVNRQVALDRAIAKASDPLVKTLAIMYRVFPLDRPSPRGLFAFKEFQSQNVLPDTLPLPTLDLEFKQVLQLAREIPLSSSIDQRSQELAQTNYTPSMLLRNLLDIELNCGADSAMRAWATTEICSVAQQVCAHIKESQHSHSSSFHTIADHLHNRFRFKAQTDLSLIHALCLHRFDSKVAALFFIEVLHQLKQSVELFLVAGRDFNYYVLGVRHGLEKTLQYWDPLSESNDAQSFLDASQLLIKIRERTEFTSLLTRPIPLSSKALCGMHLLDLTKDLYRQALTLQKLGSLGRDAQQTAAYADLIFKQQKVSSTALKIYPHLTEAYLRLSNHQKAALAARTFGGDDYCKALSL